VVTGDIEATTDSSVDELSGKLRFSNVDDKLMHQVLDADKDVIDKGKLISDAINRGMSAFTPDLLYENLVKNYALTQHLYGKSLLRHLTGYGDEELGKNMHLPEFRRELLERIRRRIDELQKDKLLDNKNAITDKAVELASIVMYVEELDRLMPRGHGERAHRRSASVGDREEIRGFRHDRYRDISVQKTVKVALKRNHGTLSRDDLRVFERRKRGQISIIYALDASGSMRGKKIESCKKAGIALAYQAIDGKDLVGLIVFGKEVKQALAPSSNFGLLLKQIATIRAQSETDISATIRKAVDLFPKSDVTKHLVLITDAMPTTGTKPEHETLEAASLAKSNSITISLVGIELSKKGRELAEQIVKIGEGRLYSVKNVGDVDRIVLDDYYRLE
jgi:Mg-chelatase subunit ChlD